MFQNMQIFVLVVALLWLIDLSYTYLHKNRKK